MLIFGIGPSGSGKSSVFAPLLDAHLERAGVDCVIVEAGGWCRRAVDPDPPETLRKRLTEHAIETLKKHPSTAVDWVRTELKDAAVGIVLGIRNPYDFAQLFDWRTDAVVFLHGWSSDAFEETGILAIRKLLMWADELGISCNYFEFVGETDFSTKYFDTIVDAARHAAPRSQRHLAVLPTPEPVMVEERWLRGLSPSAEGWASGHLVALESYPGKPVTAMFKGELGGTFHDLPLEALRASFAYGELETPPALASYGPADVGSPVLEAPPIKKCTVFGKDRLEIGRGKSLAALHWPEGNTLYHLVVAGNRFLLWPNHKLLFNGWVGGELPSWSKLPAYEAVGKEVQETWQKNCSEPPSHSEYE
jgi:hypothetical protein